MKPIKAALCAAGLSAMVAVIAGGQMGSFAANGEATAEALTDTKGNLHVPEAYRTTYEFLGTWAVAADQGPVRKSFMSSMRLPELSPPIGTTENFPMAQYS
jgi:hypothetical protein